MVHYVKSWRYPQKRKYIILHCRQSWTVPRQQVTCTPLQKTLWSLDVWFFETCERTDRQTRWWQNGNTVIKDPIHTQPWLYTTFIAERGIREDTRARVRQQPSRLLQQPAARCQRRAAAEVTGHSERGHTSGGGIKEVRPYHPGLHWLPVRQRIRFKLTMIVYKCLHGLAPPYLADDCVLVSSVASRRHLRSADTRKLVVCHTNCYWRQRFRGLLAVIWSSLPIDLRVSSLSAATFARHLKACLFRRPSYIAHLRTIYFALYKCTHYYYYLVKCLYAKKIVMLRNYGWKELLCKIEPFETITRNICSVDLASCGPLTKNIYSNNTENNTRSMFSRRPCDRSLAC